MGPVLDSGAVTFLARSVPGQHAIRRRDVQAFVVPTTVLVECLTGDHRRDHATNRFLRRCDIVPVDEPIARRAAVLRAAAGRPTASATDATVVALAHAIGAEIVLTGDSDDLAALAGASDLPLRVEAI